MAVIERYEYGPMVGDPDDHRPNTTWALVTDPESEDCDYVRDLTLLFERCAVGDRMPLHTHPISEAIIIDGGDAEVTVGDERDVVVQCGSAATCGRTRRSWAAMAIQGYVTLTLEAFPEGKSFVSRCRELGVTSCGDSVGEALEAVTDAVSTYLNAIEQLGERERIFAEKGIETPSIRE